MCLVFENARFNKVIKELEKPNFDIEKIHKIYKNKSISLKHALDILHTKSITYKNRFEIFIALYDASLKENETDAYECFKYSYCSSNNIYSQIRNSEYNFDIKKYLKNLKDNNFDFKTYMNNEEKAEYDKLKSKLIIYRGMDDDEYKSKNYGISWTTSEQLAGQFATSSVNNAKSPGLITFKADKEDVLTVFVNRNSSGKEVELIILS